MAGAADRPIFDFELSLDLAKALNKFAATLETECGLRQTVRDENLAEWKGKFGDNHRERATAEDEDTGKLVDEMREAADEWRTKWRESADEMNNVLWNEAIEVQQAYVAEQKAIAESKKSIWDRAVDLGTAVVAPGYEVYKWLNGGSDSAHLDVPSPKDAMLPTTGFIAASNTFASYHREGDVLVIRYVEKPPASAVN